jgi:hypothetical protein
LPVVFTAGTDEGEATIQAKVAGAPTAETMLKILQAHPDMLNFEVEPVNLISGTTANMVVTVLDHWGDPVANSVVRVGVEGDGENGTVAAASASQASAGATLQLTDVVTLTTDSAGQVTAVFTKDPAAMGRVGVRAELLFDEGEGLEVALEERREIILSQSGLFTRNIFLPVIADEE